MKVEVLYFADCPHHAPTVRLVQDLLHQDGILADVIEVEVRTAEQAQAIGFLGSPSLRIDGMDVEPESRTVRTFGLGCRTYVENGQRTGTPSAEMIRRAIRSLREKTGQPPPD